MDAVNLINLALYAAMLWLCVVLARRGYWPPAIIVGTMALHGLIYSGVYFYRTLIWDACPPFCGLGIWASSLRLHALIAILLGVLDRLWVPRG